MARKTARQPASVSAADLEAAVACIGAMGVEQLRGAWRETFGSDPVAALSKDLMARALAHRLQEQALAGLPAATRRLLRAMTRDGSEPPRRIKIGSVIIREYQGTPHEVLVVPGGFCWNGETYASLSTIARAITGTSWNGPRFFGLRGKERGAPTAPEEDMETQRVDRGTSTSVPGSGRRSSIRNSVLAGRPLGPARELVEPHRGGTAS